MSTKYSTNIIPMINAFLCLSECQIERCNGREVVNKMNNYYLCSENSYSLCNDGNKDVEFMKRGLSRQSLKAKFDKEYFSSRANGENCSRIPRTGGSWCDALSLPVSNYNLTAKQAWKNSTGKISQTFNNVRTTFGALSQKIKKSTKRRQPLVNLDSPKTPVTPCTRSKTLLGRTPTKLYSPFSIDTPTEKENIFRRTEKIKGSNKSNKRLAKKEGKEKTPNSQIGTPNTSFCASGVKLSNDLLQTQIGIYEFQSVANKIVHNNFKN